MRLCLLLVLQVASPSRKACVQGSGTSKNSLSNYDYDMVGDIMAEVERKRALASKFGERIASSSWCPTKNNLAIAFVCDLDDGVGSSS
mmetsp:Transcript_130/g.173  ORF Transcript_130/g.173 Transcript_130/m.173 type:complete len:88 (+) Transcript_130:525-788(+)